MSRACDRRRGLGRACARGAVPVLLALAALSAPGRAEAQVFHVVRPGDTLAGIAAEYYGDPGRQLVLRAVHGLPAEGEVTLAPGELLVIPERRHRVVGQGESWADLAREELGSADRAWLLAELNATDPREEPEAGRVIVVPYLMPLAISDGLPATVERYYPGVPARERAQMLKRVNPALRARVVRGTRVVLPFAELEILPSRRATLEHQAVARRRPGDVERQDEAAQQLARLQDLLGGSAYAEAVELAGRIAGGAELTAAQQVRLHRYAGQAYVALERADLAEREFRMLLALQPDFQFDQVTTSPSVLDVLERARRPERPPGAGGGAVDRR